MSASSGFALLSQFIAKPVCQAATAPLKNGVQIAVRVDSGPTWTVRRVAQGTEVTEEAAEKPDMTFSIPLVSLEKLVLLETKEVGEVGVALLQSLIHEDPAERLEAKVHIGPIDLFWKGYLGIIPLGGPTVMKFLASKGITGISKIKEGIARFRD